MKLLSTKFIRNKVRFYRLEGRMSHGLGHLSKSLSWVLGDFCNLDIFDSFNQIPANPQVASLVGVI